jgi:hypothetical protein
MKFGLKYYSWPTPRRIKHLADAALIALGAGGSLAVVLNVYPHIGGALALLSIVAKFVSECFSDAN